MKLIPTNMRAVAATAAIVAFTISVQAWQGMPIQQLHVSGRNLVDGNGNPVLLHGYMQAATSYFNGGSGVEFTDPTSYNPSDVASELSYYEKVAQLMSSTGPVLGQSHGWYCSYVRYLDGNCGWDSNGNLTDSGMFNRWIVNELVPYVEYCRSVGLYVVICGQPTEVFPGGDAGKNMTSQYKQNLITWWTAVAGNVNIKNADNVMFEICNEPVSVESSLGNGDWGFGSSSYNAAFQTYMQDIANAIRNTGANNVIWIPALAWETTMWQFVNYPISGNNIAYVGHWYPNGDNTASDFVNGFNANWKPCTDRYPLLITECAWIAGDSYTLYNGTTDVFGNTTKNLFDTQGNVSWDIGMVNDDIGNLSGGWSNITAPTTDCGQAAFAWWQTYTWAAPTDGLGVYKIINRNSGKALDAANNASGNGAQIDQWTYSGGQNQQWIINSVGSGLYSIVGVQSGRCIDIAGNGTGNGTQVDLWDYLGGANQQFHFNATSSGYFEISPNNATSSCLDVSGASTSDGAVVDLWAYSGGNNQQWLLQPIDATYRFMGRQSGKAVDVSSQGTANGTQIDQWTYNGGGNQLWTLTDTGGGIYKVIGAQSGRSLDIYNGGSANGTTVDIWDYYNNAGQQWTFMPTDVGYFRITPQCATGSCLDVAGQSTADGALVDLWQWGGGNNQQWQLIDPPPATPGPTGLAATSATAQVALKWNATSGATSYKVKRSIISNGPYTVIATVTTTNYNNTGLTNGTTYYYVVSAVKSGGETGNSSQVGAKPIAAPTGLTAVAGTKQVALSWTASAGAQTYNVYRGTAAGQESSTPIASGISTASYTNTGLTTGTTYYYKVAAVNFSGTSSLSSEVSAKAK